MPRELDHVRRRSEELVRRNLGSRAARDQARRRIERGARSAFIRVRRGAMTFFGLLVALIGYSLLAGSFGIMATIGAIFLSLFAAIFVLFLPVRLPPERAPATIDGGTAVRLDALAGQAENYLLDRSRALPHHAGPALDRILDRLRDLEPALATVPADTPMAGEAQRLIGQHLPGLVDNYLALPPSERPFDGDTSRQLAESLGIVANELDHLCERIGEERRTGFETERRFLETRYRDGLSLDKPG